MRFYGAKVMHVTVVKSQKTPIARTMGHVNASPSWPITLRKDKIETREKVIVMLTRKVDMGEDSNPVPKKNGNDSVYLI
eukprot:gene7345-16985_t